MNEKLNIVLVIFDSLRKDHVGAYGNEWIHTPHLDAFARESVVFTRCYPESLPTLPVRRALHTGKRTFPYVGHRPYRGDVPTPVPGWGPIPEDQNTLAETLSATGYRTAFVTDTYHQFKASKNFNRGFDNWLYIRGQETDRYRSGPEISDEMVFRHLNEHGRKNPHILSFLKRYLRNVSGRKSEEDYFAARVFIESAHWILDNTDAEKFFLVIDSFDPHEPWDPPVHYRRLYDPDDDGVDHIQSLYCTYQDFMTPREVKRLQANYAGEVTMADRWFGHFMEALKLSGRLEDTIVAIISDHGHNLGHEPEDMGLIGKQGHPMTRAVADLVMMVRHPSGQGAGMECNKLVYDHDLSCTLLQLAGISPGSQMEGLDFWEAVMDSSRETREYTTIGWGSLITVINDRWWYNANIWGDGSLLFDLKADPKFERNLADRHPDICKELLELAVKDAGGKIPEHFSDLRDTPPCKLFSFGKGPYETAARQEKFL
jgi:arylsulfatase A-like enzyme